MDYQFLIDQMNEMEGKERQIENNDVLKGRKD